MNAENELSRPTGKHRNCRSLALLLALGLATLPGLGCERARPAYQGGETPKYPKAIIEAYRQVAVASLADAMDKIAGRRAFMDHDIRPRINEQRIVGPAVTVLEERTDEVLPPQLALDAIDESPPGSVLVISMGGETDVAAMGGLMTAGAVAHHHAGAILDGGLRDIAEIKANYGFPIFSRSVSMGTGVGRYKTIALNVPVHAGGIEVNPDDLVIADVDGVIVVPKANVEAVLKMAQEIDIREAEQSKAIKATGSLREGLKKYGRI